MPAKKTSTKTPKTKPPKTSKSPKSSKLRKAAKTSKIKKTAKKSEVAATTTPTVTSPENQEQLIVDILNQLLSHLGVPAQAQAQFDQETQYHYVQIEAENPGILIGYRGDTLSALQTMVNLLVQENLKTWPRIVLNIGDYRQRREQTLIQLAKNAAQRVQFSGQPYTFGPLSPGERRIIHLALQDHSGITTHSEGEQKFRRLVVTPK